MAYTIEQCVAHVIANSTAIDNIIDGRYYVMNLPQNATYPALTWRKLFSDEHHNIDVAYDRFEFSCWAQTYAGARALAKRVKERFQRMNDDLVGGSSGLRIYQGVFAGDMDLYEDETQLYHVPVDIILIYQKE